jgi:hypothetical protein
VTKQWDELLLCWWGYLTCFSGRCRTLTHHWPDCKRKSAQWEPFTPFLTEYNLSLICLICFPLWALTSLSPCSAAEEEERRLWVSKIHLGCRGVQFQWRHENVGAPGQFVADSLCGNSTEPKLLFFATTGMPILSCCFRKAPESKNTRRCHSCGVAET